jgi:uncharacterized membrane protein/nitrite reductase/ring-hydroxylating ferredoxin subunit
VRSKAHIKSHPLHPILVVFPIAFFIGTFLCDLIFIFTNKIIFIEMAKYLEIAGILFAVLAAIPGIIDYFGSVPPESSAMKRATQHAILNFTMLFIFAMALLLRLNNEISIYVILFLEMAGVIVLTIAGWLGGTLVHRNQIGIDHRYANAGRWQEETIRSNSDQIEMKNLEFLKVNQMKLLKINGIRIVIARTETGHVAFEDRCTHRGGSLADGTIVCETVQCPWHGSQFHIRTGAVKAGPATTPIKNYELRIQDQKVFLQLRSANPREN